MRGRIRNGTVGRTSGGIIDPQKAFKRELNLEVEAYDRRKKAKELHNFKNALKQTTACSKCKRKFDKRLADAQIANKREDAPICIPCIMGVKRKPLSVVKKEGWLNTKETRKKIREYRKNISRKNNLEKQS